MPANHRTWLCVGLALALVGCAGPEQDLREPSSPGRLPALLEGTECTARTVVALCAAEGCRFYWCSAVAPAIASGRLPRNPDGSWPRLPGAIHLSAEPGTGWITPEPIFSRGADGAVLQTPAPLRREQAPERSDDVIQQILILEKPGEVAAWWESRAIVEPWRFSRSLSEWESRYIEAMSSPRVPQAIRMWPPVTPEHLTAEQRESAVLPLTLVGGS